MVNGGRVNSLACINFAKNVQDNLARGFCHELAQMCQISGMPDHVERALSTRYHDAMTILQPQGKELDLLIVILPDNDGDQKKICETGLVLVSQCCLTKHVFRMSKQYLANVGGRDTVLVDALSRTTMNGKKGSSIHIDICLPPNATPQSENMKKSTKDHNGKATIPMRKLMMEVWEFAREDTDRVTFSLKVGLACLLVSLLILIQAPYQVFSTNFILEKVGIKK
ncbi:hypothetical protein ZIOFF_018939 [Zingiber officinale]|uniref:Uncharacterized protein n=1 Tax=Zingiber officinale TaxID=94328 RepID=A0A8J5LJ09_ZINOF|nr:hypothetical protein ZIOFF_018939 [Zingiber officinale]